MLFARGAFPLSTSDLFHIQFAAYEWKQGTLERIYTSFEPAEWEAWRVEWERTAKQFGADLYDNPHFYPPFVSAALAPVADVPAVYWRNAVFVLNCLLLIALVEVTRRLCQLPPGWRGFVWLMAFFLASVPLASAVRFGQFALLVTLCTWSGLLALSRHRESAAGLLIGLAAAIKLTPVAFLAIPTIQRRWRPVLFGGSLVVTLFAASWLVLRPEIHAQWWRAAQDASQTVWPNALDQSLSSWFARLFLGCSVNDLYFPQPPTIRLLRILGNLVFGLGTMIVLWVRRRNLTVENFPAAAGLMVSGVVLALPFAWNYYFLLSMPVLAWALLRSETEQDRTVWRYVLWTVAFLVFMRFWRWFGDGGVGKIAAGHIAIANLLLYAWLVQRFLTNPAIRNHRALQVPPAP
ncbi:DUF2029 domain-containing protein [candidate division KSB1 bacterium]|nr:DUF2029 domain-containing protein [candidate division KSB1 bacterium]